ncbi:succinate dehydrogenase, cytochrome b556 subunit [Rhodobaculum claviforme]|uniref:Succinate dehydrogenase cytochrome b556 subunit n=1 Tax=Rhodobaculum claviforme TaxID=1549854 RepID=A0A934TLR6_9RHOB|nr:succinate dehydrogenase, cytochrome b556 subunit [Rhodobaculum claviforme]MBK5928150.1 succinate dehydrogenase, cytochrome b556 subunit [Rhodobaculum claviforme]
MADVNRGNRPLSPHLQIYRLPMTARLSILFRITGVGMTLGALLVTWRLIAGAVSPEASATADAVLTSGLGNLVMLGSLWALMFHACNGVRHLVWDAGFGFDLATAEKSNMIVVGASVVLTLLVVLIIR